jgi:uncharacterized protein (DUF983 family)
MTSQDEQKFEEGDKPSFLQDVKDALHNRCPRCKNASIFATPFALNPREECPSCGFKLSAHDNGDGPAVFLIFILGFLLVPFAIVTQFVFAFPLWFNTIFWTAVALILCLVLMRPLKSYIMLLQYRHLPKTFGDEDTK